MGSLINSSNILNSLTGSGMRAKNFTRLTSGNQFEFSGGRCTYKVNKLFDY